MKSLANSPYLLAYLISNVVGLLILWAGLSKPKLARLILALLFGGACWVNYTTAFRNPEFYLDYGSMAIDPYTDFINGWFREHIRPVVTLISIGQGAVAVGMLMNRWRVRLACIGTILFLLSIAPLGVGAAFPFSLIVSLAAYFIQKNDDLNYLWQGKW